MGKNFLWALHKKTIGDAGGLKQGNRDRLGFGFAFEFLRGTPVRTASIDWIENDVTAALPDIVELNELLEQLAQADPKAAELVKLRFFAGLTVEQTAQVLGISPRSADFLWSYARAWLFEKLNRQGG